MLEFIWPGAALAIPGVLVAVLGARSPRPSTVRRWLIVIAVAMSLPAVAGGIWVRPCTWESSWTCAPQALAIYLAGTSLSLAASGVTLWLVRSDGHSPVAQGVSATLAALLTAPIGVFLFLWTGVTLAHDSL